MPLLGRVEAGETVTLGIRPEHVVVGAGGGFTASATLVEMLGSDTFIHLGTPAGTLVVRDSAGRRVRAGHAVPVSLPAAACHLFGPGGDRVSADPSPRPSLVLS